jgi:hypothetical protein
MKNFFPSEEMKGHPSRDGVLKSGCAPGGAVSMSSAGDHDPKPELARAATELVATINNATTIVGADRLEKNLFCLLLISFLASSLARPPWVMGARNRSSVFLVPGLLNR